MMKFLCWDEDRQVELLMDTAGSDPFEAAAMFVRDHPRYYPPVEGFKPYYVYISLTSIEFGGHKTYCGTYMVPVNPIPPKCTSDSTEHSWGGTVQGLDGSIQKQMCKHCGMYKVTCTIPKIRMDIEHVSYFDKDPVDPCRDCGFWDYCELRSEMKRGKYGAHR